MSRITCRNDARRPIAVRRYAWRYQKSPRRETTKPLQWLAPAMPHAHESDERLQRQPGGMTNSLVPSVHVSNRPLVDHPQIWTLTITTIHPRINQKKARGILKDGSSDKKGNPPAYDSEEGAGRKRCRTKDPDFDQYDGNGSSEASSSRIPVCRLENRLQCGKAMIHLWAVGRLLLADKP